MSSGIVRPGGQPKTGPAALLDKLHGRQPTPDSEALASSDEEADHIRQASMPPNIQPHKPVRRASWLNDTAQLPGALPRKGSFASSSMSPTTSLPPTPSAESGAATWGSLAASSTVLGRGAAGNGSSYPWGTSSGIWNNDRKDAASRLAEVMPSPTTSMPSGAGGNGLYGADLGKGQTSPAPRDQAPNAQIPFPIPLAPTPKNYRSQSYSVCQKDLESMPASSIGSSMVMGARNRPVPHHGLQHRPSRPSMLSEMANDGSSLGKVNEDDDDDGSNGSMQGSQHLTAEQKKIDQLTRENALLRQQQEHHFRLRPRASTGAAYGLNTYFQEPVPEESDYAVDVDETNDGFDMTGKRALGRRMSEFGAGPFHSSYSALEKRKLDNVKKGIWQTSLGFNGVGDFSQSRRHSFADVPVPQRQNSIASLVDSIAPHDQVAQESQYAQDAYSVYSDGSNFASTNSVQAYFTGGANLSSPPPSMGQSNYPSQYPAGFNPLQSQYSNRAASPHRGMYPMQPRPHQSLYIVLFKCCRADVFYIQEGTGLTVKPGDLVIVEADRGTDLGTVAKDNVDWQTAKELKEHYAEEQYKWLMMYSHNAAADGAGAGLMAASNGASAVGGMGPPNPHHMQEPNNGELKPKLIKRLAQAHEIMALREKEGNEAKAKRVCMQKVKEHNLNMEILDAEFQMDWKKLTFYYFADSYINFNSLVTDLFKIYKTRIWMSAINPASFASPGSAIGLQAPSGVGPGAVRVDLVAMAQERRQTTSSTNDKPPAASQNSAGRGLRTSTSHPFLNETPAMPPSALAGNYPNYNPYGPFSTGARPGVMGYGQITDQFPSMYAQAQAPDYTFGRGRFATSPMGNAQSPGFSHMGSQQEMYNNFEGLSLNQ